MQPDFGTALVYGAALAAVLFVAGTRWLTMAVARAAPCSSARSLILWALPAAGAHVLQAVPGGADHRLPASRGGSARARRTTSRSRRSPSAPAGSTAAASRARRRRTSSYLPEHATDFVFASFAEQRGFFGAAILLCLYLLVVWRGLRIITVARDPFSAIVAGGIVVAFLFQIYVNVGMTMGIAPITGIPLPFISVGGSSMIANLAAMGVLLSIHARGARRSGGDEAAAQAGRGPRAAARRCASTSDKPMLVGGTLADQLARELTAGGDASAVRVGDEPRDVEVFVYVIGDSVTEGRRARAQARPPRARADDRRRRRAEGAARAFRSCSRPTSCASQPGHGFPVDDDRARDRARSSARRRRRSRGGCPCCARACPRS